MIIAITGNIGCGKTTASNKLKSLGFSVIDADLLAREAVLPKTPALEQIINKFGTAVINKDGSLNRKKLGEQIFSNPDKKKELEEILHPIIREKYLNEVSRLSKITKTIFYIVPLYFESKEKFKYEEVSKCLLIACNPEIAIKRIIDRDNLSDDEANKRYNSQISQDEKIKLADYVIWNNGEKNELEEKLEDWIKDSKIEK